VSTVHDDRSRATEPAGDAATATGDTDVSAN
jgi:hypothetical protein